MSEILTPGEYRWTSTKEYVQAFPVAYRQWRDDKAPGEIPSCSFLHGYALSITLDFSCQVLDKRMWSVSFGGLRNLKYFLQTQMDHTVLVAHDDPHLDWYMEAQRRGIAKVIVLPHLGCEAIADMLYKYVNGVFIPQEFGSGEAERIWCNKITVRESDANSACRIGHRHWNEDLWEELTPPTSSI